MKHLLIATSNQDNFSRFVTNLDGGIVDWVGSVDDVMRAVSGTTPDLVIIDEELDGHSWLTVAREVIMKNAMVNLAVVSSMPSAEFHDTAEGLGILAQLSPEPDETRAAELMNELEGLPQYK